MADLTGRAEAPTPGRRIFRDLDPGSVRANVAQVRERLAAAARQAGREPGDVRLLAAVKYVPLEELGVLADAGIDLVGENRAQDLEVKARARPAFEWHFIGALQSRKVKQVLPHAALIHSVASDSALKELGRHAPPGTRVLVEVNVAGEASKAGIDPDELAAFIARCPVAVAGLMVMPPAATRPEDSRPHFARARELAAAHGLDELSMGTSQDFEVAAQEGATIVRIGSILFQNPG